MRNDIKKSRNNTPTSPICEIKGYLGKIVNFMVKVNHPLHDSVAELDIEKFDIALFSIFHHFAPDDNHTYVFDTL